jgi:hypothetical protein
MCRMQFLVLVIINVLLRKGDIIDTNKAEALVCGTE